MQLTTSTKKQDILLKISLFLFGIFTTTIVFALSLRLFDVNGIWIGLILSILIVILGFYYTKKHTTLRTIIWGILITVIVGAASYIILLKTVTSMLEGL